MILQTSLLLNHTCSLHEKITTSPIHVKSHNVYRNTQPMHFRLYKPWAFQNSEHGACPTNLKTTTWLKLGKKPLKVASMQKVHGKIFHKF
jgi:hypothetical protein